MTDLGSYFHIRKVLDRLDRKRNAKELDELALKVADAWRVFRKRIPLGTLSEFARLYDETVPTELDDYWDNPVYQKLNYLLARAGAQPVISKRHLPKKR